MHTIYERTTQFVTILLLSVVLVACGGGEKESRNRTEPDTPAAVVQQQAGRANPSATTVNVVARDFEFLLDNSSVQAGAVTFVVTNQGSMPHDFAITIDGERHKTSMITPGSSSLLTVELQPGAYDYLCTVPGHDILGMKGSFTAE